MTKILVIDDSALMRSFTRDYLETAGFVVDDFLPESVSALLEHLKQSPPDLVLTDFAMPKVNGMQVTRAVRHSHPKLPIIILTANRDEGRDALLLSIGVRKIIFKPIKSEDLVAAVQKVLMQTQLGNDSGVPHPEA